jgi:hypothetical protein
VLDALVPDPLQHCAPGCRSRRRPVLAPHHRAPRGARRARRLRSRSCHSTPSLEMEKAPDGDPARGLVASQRPQDCTTPQIGIRSRGFRSRKP